MVFRTIHSWSGQENRLIPILRTWRPVADQSAAAPQDYRGMARVSEGGGQNTGFEGMEGTIGRWNWLTRKPFAETDP
jgi:hypothetical protein